MHPPDKPNPTTGLDGRAGRSLGRFRDKQDEKYADRSDFASAEASALQTRRISRPFAVSVAAAATIARLAYAVGAP